MARATIVTLTDLETTGLEWQEGHEIIQLAAIKLIHPVDDPFNPRVMENGVLEIKVMPTIEVPEEATKINGYNSDVWAKEAVSLDKALLKYFSFLEWTNFGGQNPHFDKTFLEVAASKCGLKWPRMQGYRLVAVEILAWPLFLRGEIPNVKQETLAAYFNLGEQTHDALDDIKQSAEIYKRLLQMSKP